MHKRGASVIIGSVILIIIVVIFAGIFIRWALPYSDKITREAEEHKKDLDTSTQVVLRINSVNIDSNGLQLLLENRGRLSVGKVLIRTTIPEGATDNNGKKIPPGIYSKIFPIDINPLEIKNILVFYPELPSGDYGYGEGALKDFELIEVIPTVKLEDGSESTLSSGGDKWIGQS